MNYRLTSPHMGSKAHPVQMQHIEAFQRELKLTGYFKGKVDGEYGPETAQAVFDVKSFRFGYARPDRTAGDTLYAYLTGKKKPNAAMKLIAARRRSKHDNITARIFKAYLLHLNVTESPANSNRVYASLWYGFIGPWCAMAYSWSAAWAGSKIFKAGTYEAYVPTLVLDAMAGRNKLKRVFTPFTGCGVTFKWPGESNAIADHIGCYVEEQDLKDAVPTAFTAALAEFGPLGEGDFWTIEGNTAAGNDSNGGKQQIRKRNKANVVVYFSVGG